MSGEIKAVQIRQNCQRLSQMGGELSNLIAKTRQLVTEVPTEAQNLTTTLASLNGALAGQTGGKRGRGRNC